MKIEKECKKIQNSRKFMPQTLQRVVSKEALLLKGMVALFLSTRDTAYSSESSSPHFNFYEIFGSYWNLSGVYSPLIASLFLLICTIVLGICYKKLVQKALLHPQGEIEKEQSLGGVLGCLVEFVYGLVADQCGKYTSICFPFVFGLFSFILLSNLSGLLPGFPPPTEVMSINVSLGVLVFLWYNGLGIKEHGFSYIKQFTGPFLVLAPMFLIIELVSHMARPLSLALRLTINIYGDHLILAKFTHMVPWLLPACLLAFGLLVACIQSFVFSLLTCIYVNMAISHDH